VPRRSGPLEQSVNLISRKPAGKFFIERLSVIEPSPSG
jgi:hypothetical protein